MPHIRHKHISDIIQNLNFTPSNLVLNAFGIVVQPTFFKIPSTKIWRPAVQMGGAVSQPKDDGNFRLPFKYLAPATVKKWAVFYADRGVNSEAIKTFVTRFCAEAKNKRMNVPPPSLIQPIDIHNFMEKAFVKIKDLGVSYILIIDPKSDPINSHGNIKLVENRYKIVTQHLDSDLVEKCVMKNQRMTLENILNKTNLKLGGTNYAPKFEDEAWVFLPKDIVT